MATEEQVSTASVTARGGGVQVELALPDDPRSATQARAAVGSLEGHAHPETLAKTRLLITEMVAAATAADAGHEIVVRMGVADGVVRGEVDGGRAVATRPKGWGLLLVRRIAARWGMVAGTVWFEVDDRDWPKAGA